MTGIPEQLVGQERFLKIEPESKAPTVSPEGPFFAATDTELQDWIQSGGNVGLNLGPLVALDVDSDQFKKLAGKHLRSTFSVRSGSGGEHRYYRCDWSGRAQFTDGEEDLGSIRSGNWYLVVPPSTHPNGKQYYTLRDKPIQTIAVSQLEDFIQAVDETANTARRRRQQQPGGGGGGGCVGSSIPIAKMPDEYPDRPAEWRTARDWLSANGLLESLNRTTCSDWSGLEFKVAKCLAEGGFSESVISDVLDRLHHNSKWHRRGSTYQRRTVRNAIVAACQDEYVDFSDTGDMTGNTVESRKTEESGEGRTLAGGDKMTDFNETDEFLAKESSDQGGTAVKAVKVEGHDPEDGSNFEFVSLRKGSLQERETADGDTALIVDIDDRDGDSIGSPDDLDVIIEALEGLRDEIDD